MSETIKVSVVLEDEFFEDVIDTAGYGIGYWAVRAQHDAEARTYTIFPDTEAQETLGKDVVVVTYEGMARAIEGLLDGTIPIAKYIQEYISRAVLQDGDAGEIDATAADVIVQAAGWGAVTFG